MFQKLANFDQLALEVFILLGHVLDALALPCFAVNDATLVTSVNAELTSILVACIVFLEHLSFTAIVRALDCSVIAFILMARNLGVGHNDCATFVSILTCGLNLIELLHEERMGFDELE